MIPMRHPVRLATASLFVLAALALSAGPAAADQLLPLPSLPVPVVSVPSPPDLPEAPELPPTPSVAPLPVLAPRLPSSPVSAPRLALPQDPAPQSPGQGDRATSRSQGGQPVKASSSAKRRTNAVAAGTQAPRPTIVQADHPQDARTRSGVDDYLLTLVHDELCTALASLVDPMPEALHGLSPELISRLPSGIVNVVPFPVLEHATVRCATAAPSGAGSSRGHDGPLTGGLGTLTLTGMVGAAALPLGLGLLALGVGLRVQGRSIVERLDANAS
jgi:hypothetical protein